MSLLDRAGIARLIPHAGAMCLWDELLSATDAVALCRTDSHRRGHNPLRRDGRLAALHLIEYGAQAMAVHGGWLAHAAGSAAQPGVLAAVRDLQLQVDYLDDLAAPLECTARRLVANAGGWLYEFEISSGGRELGRGRASVIHLPKSEPVGAA
ncbi:MAG TPA: hypothetical protein VM074_00555 [Solimonas sp.]|nr:hypothetical protein [Solimonas sp.]